MNAEKVLLEKINGEYSNCRIPGLIRTEKGTLLCSRKPQLVWRIS